jgi:ketosteroid isomerase-like protein
MSSASETAVRQAADQFYSALNTMFTGDLAPMKAVWSHADDVTFMGPGGGVQVGWDKVLETLEGHAAMKLGGKVMAKDVRLTVGDGIAVMHNMELGENTNAAGKPQKVAIRATSLFRKEGGAWKMIAHHTDKLPYIKD